MEGTSSSGAVELEGASSSFGDGACTTVVCLEALFPSASSSALAASSSASS